MSDDREAQLDAFKEAVDRKAADAEEASHHAVEHPAGDDVGPGKAPDADDPRTGGSRQGKVTADKWNQ